MQHLNLDEQNVFQAEASVDAIRQFLDGADLPEEVTTKMDEAQGFVFSGNGRAFIVIEVT